MLGKHIWGRELFYHNHLTEISNIKFTFREIDVIACVTHNRGEKKIASLLEISYRTVGVHIRNIMSKLGHSSREYLIDFIEKSGKLKLLRQYYSEILVESSFRKQLEKLAKSLKNEEVCFMYEKNEISDDESNLLDWVQKFLKLANIKCTKSSIISEHQQNNNDITYIVFGNETNASKMSKSTKYIALTMDKDANYLDKDVAFVNFANNPFMALLKLIEKITHHPETSKIIKSFESEYKSLDNSFEDGEELDQFTITKKAENSLEKKKLFFYRGNFLLLFVAFLAFVSIYYWVGNQNKENGPSIFGADRSNINTAELNIVNIESRLANLTKKFKSDNLDSKQRMQNEEYINEIGSIISNVQNSKEIRYYFITDASPKNLINYLHNSFTLSVYYFYSLHDAKKGREILAFSKKLVEDFLNNRNRGPNINFDKLIQSQNFEALYTELSIIESLPETYTRIIYQIGRSYVYDNNIEKGEKYFQISSKLGKKLGLFEGFLSDVSGLGRILIIESEKHLKNNEDKAAKGVLEKVIALYAGLKEDNGEYIINYEPAFIASANKSQKRIIPGKDLYNLARCNLHLLNAYRRLLTLKEVESKKIDIIHKVSDIITLSGSKASIKNTTLQGALTNPKLGRKEKAIINIAIANLLLSLEKESEKMSPNSIYIKLQQDLVSLIASKIVSNQSKLVPSDKLSLAYELYKRAEGQSRNTDYTKADAHHGMAEVLRIRNKEGSNQEMEAKVKEHEMISDNINKSLGRIPAGI